MQLTLFEGLMAPWSLLVRQVPDVQCGQIELVLLGDDAQWCVGRSGGRLGKLESCGHAWNFTKD